MSNATPDLAALAATLQQTAQTLLTLSTQAQSTTQNEPVPNPRAEEGGEIRSYYFPPAMVRQEQALLGEFRAADLPELLEQTHALLSGIVRIMRNTRTEAKIRGSAFVSMGTLLEQVCTRLSRMRTIYDHQAVRIEP